MIEIFTRRSKKRNPCTRQSCSTQNIINQKTCYNRIGYDFNRVFVKRSQKFYPFGAMMDLVKYKPETIGMSQPVPPIEKDRKSTRLNSSHTVISYAVFCLK